MIISNFWFISENQSDFTNFNLALRFFALAFSTLMALQLISDAVILKLGLSSAIEIAKLRLWLSLIVDEEDYSTIQTLPNLDYKIMQGNSLIEEFHGISLDIEKKDLQQASLFEGGSDLDVLIDDLHQKQDDFFNAEHPRVKKQKRHLKRVFLLAVIGPLFLYWN